MTREEANEKADAILKQFKFGAGWTHSWGMIQDIADALLAAADAEREACAKIADDEYLNCDICDAPKGVARQIRDLIRARRATPPAATGRGEA